MKVFNFCFDSLVIVYFPFFVYTYELGNVNILHKYNVLYAHNYNDQHWDCFIGNLLGEGLLLLSNHTLHIFVEIHL